MIFYGAHHRCKQLAPLYPGRIGCLIGPNCRFNPGNLPYVVDNGRFIACVAANGYPKSESLPGGGSWDSHRFKLLLDYCRRQPQPPRWVVVPDVVANAEATIAEWSRWAPWIQDHYGFPLAVAVQDGMTPAHVQALRPAPVAVFVGGTYWWKRNSAPRWSAEFPNVHVGRVNSHDFLWECEDAGVASVDGTGWWRAGPARLQPLVDWLNRVRHPAKTWPTADICIR
jgi:hypothetical protein